MKLFSYYQKATIYPSLFVLFFCIVYSIIVNYESGGLTDTSAIVTSVITSFLFCLLMSGLSATIFLNKIKKFNSNFIWNLLSWFFLPFFYITIIFIYEIKIRVKYDFGFRDDFLYLLVMIVPFVAGLCWTFIKYRQKITTADTT